jgi:hypothetical protein
MKFIRVRKFYPKIGRIKNINIGVKLYIFIERKNDNIWRILCWAFREDEW